jgi:hypothetical protein
MSSTSLSVQKIFIFATQMIRVSEGLFIVELCEYGLVNPDLSVSYLELQGKRVKLPVCMVCQSVR